MTGGEEFRPVLFHQLRDAPTVRREAEVTERCGGSRPDPGATARR